MRWKQYRCVTRREEHCVGRGSDGNGSKGEEESKSRVISERRDCRGRKCTTELRHSHRTSTSHKSETKMKRKRWNFRKCHYHSNELRGFAKLKKFQKSK